MGNLHATQIFQVIYTLTHNIKLTHTEAVAMATYVDRKVRKYVYYQLELLRGC